MLLGTGRRGSRVHLGLGEDRHLLTLLDADSAVAAQVVRVHAPGTDPAKGAAAPLIDIYVASGNLGWESGGKGTEVVAPAHWRLPGDPPEFGGQTGELPNWIQENTTSKLDLRAAATLEQTMPLSRDVQLTLSEMAEQRRLEVRSLVARSAVYVGHYDSVVAALGDTELRAAWPAQLEALQYALGQGPETAEKVRATLIQLRGDEGRALYRMLWGYSKEDLEQGADAELVDNLDHEQLDFRVLAFWNLSRLSRNVGDGGYRPEYTASRRQTAVRRWRERLEAKQIRPDATPEAGS
jgi:hypothetical protein